MQRQTPSSVQGLVAWSTIFCVAGVYSNYLTAVRFGYQLSGLPFQHTYHPDIKRALKAVRAREPRHVTGSACHYNEEGSREDLDCLPVGRRSAVALRRDQLRMRCKKEEQTRWEHDHPAARVRARCRAVSSVGEAPFSLMSSERLTKLSVRDRMHMDCTTFGADVRRTCWRKEMA